MACKHTFSKSICLAVAAVALWLPGGTARAEPPYNLAWTRQLGTDSSDYCRGVSADGLGNVYIGGYTYGSLCEPNAGGLDAFLAKYDAAGSLLWTRQLGTTDGGQCSSVSADGLGNVYMGGYYWRVDGPEWDAFLAKYDADGSLLWTRQLGTAGGDFSYGVSADGLGNVYIGGGTFGSLGGPNAGGTDVFLAKYGADGSLLWTCQLGTTGDEENSGVSADGLGNVYISGITSGSLGGPNAGEFDAFLAKYDADGSLLWTRQLGTAGNEWSTNGVSADGLGNVYIDGGTTGSLGGPNAGPPETGDAFLAKYDADGSLLWTRQLGTAGHEENCSVSADGLGSVYTGGITTGSLGGPNAGPEDSCDAFLAKYDADGSLLWTRQLGTVGDEIYGGVSADGPGNVYIGGDTTGSLGGPNAGEADAFLAKYNVPEPGTLALLGVGLAAMLAYAWCKRK